MNISGKDNANIGVPSLSLIILGCTPPFGKDDFRSQGCSIAFDQVKNKKFILPSQY
jgi:hypothetical protein